MTKIFISAAVFFLMMICAGFKTTNIRQGGTAVSVARGKEVYTQVCLSCHQVDGGGVPNMIPPLIKTKYVIGDKKQLINIVLNGLQGDVEVNGDFYHNVMPPQSTLTDQQIADVLTFVRNSFTNKATAVKVTEVKAMRALTPKAK